MPPPPGRGASPKIEANEGKTMKDNEKKKRPYASPRIMTYILGTTDPDFLTDSYFHS